MRFFAEVQWWDGSYVHVFCSFCDKIHSTHRVSHCHNGLRFRSYHFKFPYPQNPKATAYEIDKANKRYVALGASPPPAEQDSLDGALAALKIERRSANTLSKWEDATQTVTIDNSDTVLRRLRQSFDGNPTFEMKRIAHLSNRRILFEDVD